MVELTDIRDEHTADGQAAWKSFIAVLTLVTVERTSSISKKKNNHKREITYLRCIHIHIILVRRLSTYILLIFID